MLPYRIAQRPRAARGVVLAVAALILAGASPLAVSIDSITPASAARGERVTITGIGFGAGNVQISLEGVVAEVLAATGSSATFRVPFGVRPGATTVVATNPGGHSGSIGFTVVNRVPRASAGPDQTVFVATTVQLDGAASTDADGDQLTFHWSFLSRPNGSNALLSDPSAVRPTFVVDLPGRYTIQLIVNDGFDDSSPDTVLIDTQNSPPVANAGPDQTVAVGATVQLDGSGSSDVDGDLLGFRWSFVSRPAGSNATLTDATAPSPSFVADLAGRYVIQLIVNDGTVDSRPDTVTIDTRNSRPIADAGPDQTVLVGATVELDGSGSSDVDHDPLSFRWSFASRPAGSTATLSDATAVNPTFVADVVGMYVVQLIVNDGTVDGEPDTVVVTANASQPNQPPSVNAGPDQTITLPGTATLNGNVSDDGLPLGSVLAIAWSKVSGPGSVTFANPSATQTTAAFSQAGVYVLRLTASDGEFSSSDDVMVTVNPANQAPSVDAGPDQTITLPAAATLNGTVTDDGLPPGSTLTVAWSTVSGPGTATFANPNAASTTATFSTSGQYVLRLTASDGALSSSADVRVTVNPASDSGLPPDPRTVAPPLDSTVATGMARATEFVYSGASPIQTGMAPGTIEPRRAAVLRGRVMTRDGAPLPGVTLTILNRPEFGQTLSRADGMFDMAINGGGPLIVNYQKAGFLTAQRLRDIPWQDFVFLPDVVLIPVDPEMTTIDLTLNVPMQVARGRVVTDGDGTRQPTLFFPQGTQASLVFADGSTQPATTLSVRATEYTVGPLGPLTMPSELPPTSGYTYYLELTADEASAAGAVTVQFSQPVIFHLENFLGFPVGELAPVGFYDRQQGKWIGAPNGRVIKILGITAGLANLDTDGDGTVDNGAALGVTDSERQQLAALYPAGQSLWRVPTTHFSPGDINWPYGPPSDATSPNQPNPDSPDPDDQCEEGGSVIGCERQTLGEAVAIVGTPMRLHYESDRVPGRKAAYTLQIPLSGASVPASLRRIELIVSVAGRQLTQSFPAATNQRTTFTWDGLDAYGRPVQGERPVIVRIGYVYGAVYLQGSQAAERSFAILSASGLPISASIPRLEVTLWQEWRGSIGPWDARAAGLGGWTMSVHHAYDPAGRILHLGDGERRSARSLSDVITTAAGDGNFCSVGPCGDGGPATKAGLSVAAMIALGPDGSVYIPDRDGSTIRRVAPNGIITTVAGARGSRGFSGDGGPATSALLAGPHGVAVGRDGSFYIADTGNHRIRRVTPDGVITTVAGNGVGGFFGTPPFAIPPGDGGPAIQAQVDQPQWVAVGPDGSLYVSDPTYTRIRKVSPDGIITTLAGLGPFQRCDASTACGDGGPAAQAQLFGPRGVALGPDGSIYFVDGGASRIRRIATDGRISRVAGRIGTDIIGPNGFEGDGGPARDALFNVPTSVSVGPDGSLYIADQNNGRIRRVGPDGIITTVAGSGPGLSAGDGGPATQARIFTPDHALLGPDGGLYIWGSNSRRVRRVAPVLPGFTVGDLVLAAEDGSEVYVFDNAGRHLRTVHALTGATLYEFRYDSAGHLATVTDSDGNITTIERDTDGNPTALASPFGQRTTLTTDANGYLGRLTNPAGEPVQMAYTAGGSLTSFTDPRGNISRYTYDTLGRLIRADDAAGGFKTVTRTETANGYTLAVTTALGRTTTYGVERLSTGGIKRTIVDPSGAQTEILIGTDGSRNTTYPDGTVATLIKGPDPRWGMLAPTTSPATIRTPAGLLESVSTTRTATLTDPNNPLSLSAQERSVTINGRAYTSAYSGASRTFTDTTPEGRQFTATVDALGRHVRLQVAGLEPVTSTYDARGRVATETAGSGVDARTVTRSYNSGGYLQTITDPLGRTNGFAYDAAGRVNTQTLTDGRLISAVYDANGNLAAITPPGRPAHSFSFTPADLTSAYTPPDLGAGTNQTLYTYNADGQLALVSRPDGQSIDLGYDTAGRLTALTIPRGTVSYTYDPTTGNLATISAPGGIGIAYTYDGMLRTSSTWTGPVSGSVSRTYDNNFRVAALAVGGTSIAFAYDNDGLLSQAGSLTLSRSTQNDLLTGTMLGGVTDTLNYNGFGELTSYSAAYGGAALFAQQYTRDKLSRITRKTETIGGVTNNYGYSYDLAGRLTDVTRNGAPTASYTYDSNDNRLSVTRDGSTIIGSYDDQDRLIQYGGTTYAYTANGELQSKTVSGQTTTYQYDPLGNLMAVTLPSGTQITYLVDGNDRRIGKQVDGKSTQSFLYQDGLRPIAELDGSNTVVSRLVYATRGNVPDYIIKGGVTYRIITDPLGSPRLVVDVATGAVVQRLDYDEFGQLVNDTNPGFQPFGFAGGLYDRDTNLVRFGSRDYDVETGRWATKDPILFAGGQANLYAYALNDPVNFIDQQGLEGWSVGGTWGGTFDEGEGGTIICKNGTVEQVIRPEMLKFTPTRVCARQHETSHEADLPRDICKNVTGARRIVGDKRTVAKSETKAYTGTIACLENQLKSKPDGEPIGWTRDEKTAIQNFLNQCQKKLKEFEGKSK